MLSNYSIQSSYQYVQLGNMYIYISGPCVKFLNIWIYISCKWILINYLCISIFLGFWSFKGWRICIQVLEGLQVFVISTLKQHNNCGDEIHFWSYQRWNLVAFVFPWLFCARVWCVMLLFWSTPSSSTKPKRMGLSTLILGTF